MGISRRKIITGTAGSLAGMLLPWGIARAREYPVDDAERAAGIVPLRLDVPPGYLPRYGSSGDGLHDDTVALQALLLVARHRGTAVVPAGTYSVSSVRVPGSIVLSGQPGAVLVKRAGAAGTHVLECVATPGTALALRAAAARGETTVQAPPSPALRAGAIVLVRDARLAVAPYGRNQELNEITAVSGTTCTLRWPLLSDYDDHPEIAPHAEAASAIRIEGLRVDIPPGVAGGGIYLDQAYQCTVADCHVTGPSDQAGVLFWRSGRCDVLRTRIERGQGVEAPGVGYGVAIANACHHVRALGNHTVSVRENAISLGSRQCSFEDCVDEAAHDSSFNTHADGNSDCVIANCTSRNSAGYGVVLGFEGNKAAEHGCVARGNRIFDSAKDGIYCGADAGRENTGPVVKDNVIVRPARGAAGRVGIRVVRAVGAVVEGNELYDLAGARCGIDIEGCSGATVRSNRTAAPGKAPLLLRDGASTGTYEDNAEFVRATPDA